MRHALIGMLAVFGLATSAAAQPVLSDNFESYSAGDITCVGGTPGGVIATTAWDECYEDDSGGDFADMSIVTSITGYAGSMPSGTKVLRINADTPTAQVEADLRITGVDTTKIPGDVWLHAAIYIRSAGTDYNGVTRIMKFWYPCRGVYPCNDNYWLPELGQNPYNPTPATFPGGFGTDDLFVVTRANTTGTISWAGADPGDENKLGQTSQAEWIKADRWNTMVMHLDTSTSTCTFEAWIAEVGSTLVQVMDWPGGTDVAGSAFTCSIPSAGGHMLLSIPSTIPANNANGLTLDMYLDDLVVSGSEGDMPDYTSPPVTIPARTFRIKGADLAALGLIPIVLWRQRR